MDDKQKIPLATIMKFADKNNYDTDAVMDLWNQDPDGLRTFYLEALKRPQPPQGTHSFDTIMGDMADEMKGFKMKQDYRGRPKPDFANLRKILDKIRQDYKHKVTKKGVEIHFRISSEFSPDTLEETLMFPPGTDVDSEPIEMIIDQTLSSLSYEYLLEL